MPRRCHGDLGFALEDFLCSLLGLLGIVVLLLFVAFR